MSWASHGLSSLPNILELGWTPKFLGLEDKKQSQKLGLQLCVLCSPCLPSAPIWHCREVWLTLQIDTHPINQKFPARLPLNLAFPVVLGWGSQERMMQSGKTRMTCPLLLIKLLQTILFWLIPRRFYF